MVLIAQTAPVRVSPDEATKHLLHRGTPVYPSFAAATRIQGNVILEINVDESGAATVRRLVYGHPLLAPAAISSMNQWKFQRFELNGKPTAVITFVTVTYGDPSKEKDSDTRAEVLFQNEFWTAEDSAQGAMEKGDYPEAQRQLEKAQSLLGPQSSVPRHSSERWQWMISMGRLAMAQQKFDQAEQHYKQALDLRKQGDKDAPEMAMTLGELGKLYAGQKRYEPARESAGHAIAIYQKNLKQLGSTQSKARDIYSRAIANQLWMLARMATEQNDPAEVAKNCRTVMDFKEFLSVSDRDAMISTCGTSK